MPTPTARVPKRETVPTPAVALTPARLLPLARHRRRRLGAIHNLPPELGEGRSLRHYLELAASGLEAHLASVGLWLCSSSETLVRDISHASI